MYIYIYRERERCTQKWRTLIIISTFTLIQYTMKLHIVLVKVIETLNQSKQ